MTAGSALPHARIHQMSGRGNDVMGDVSALLSLAPVGLKRMYLPERMQFVQTARRDTALADGLRGEGMSLRYTAIVVLGATGLPVDQQSGLFHGQSLDEVVEPMTRRAHGATDLGALALSVWAAAAAGGPTDRALITRLVDGVDSAAPASTVALCWALCALLATDAADPAVVARLAHRLLAAQGAGGIFPHAVPAKALGRLRAHVGCFADQVYPIQALSRYFLASKEARALEAANRCADRLVQLQGSSGQWWWHYDARTAEVVERFPVYSVHQHAMGPMALFELHDAGGHDHRDALAAGLEWVFSHPETSEPLVDAPTGVVWRKVGRREPRKLARSVRAAATAYRPGARVAVLDKLLPPGPIDYECRPYELGWLLYAWTSRTPTTPSAGGRRPGDRP